MKKTNMNKANENNFPTNGNCKRVKDITTGKEYGSIAEEREKALLSEMAEFRQWKIEQEAKRKAEEKAQKEEEKRQALIAKAKEKIAKYNAKLMNINEKLCMAETELANLLVEEAM